jgi:aminoglycoside 3-N-acetyltransferase
VDAVTYRRLLVDLRALGLPRGRHVLVNCAMSRIGWVFGGPGVLLRAIRDVIGPASVVVPTQTANNSTTSRFYRAATAALSPAERRGYEARMPGFDPAVTPSYRMGLLAEHVRRHRKAVRSTHPQTSFAAVGPAAGELMRVHHLTSHLGEDSPLGALYDRGAMTLLLGVGLDQCTALHLAEYRLAPRPPKKTYTCFVARDGEIDRYEFDALDLDDGDFGDLGTDLRNQPWARTGRVGNAPAVLLPIRQAVDFARGWLQRRRSFDRS